MKKFFTSILISISTCCTFLSYSQKNYQPGYIITFSGDTVNGFIDYRNWGINPTEITFMNASGETRYFSPLNIKAFSVSNENYISGIVKVDADFYNDQNLSYSGTYTYRTDTAFLRTLVQGDKSLYQYKDINGKEHFFIGTSNGPEVLRYKLFLKDIDGKKTIVSDKKYIGQLYLYLRDCAEINEKLRDTRYKEADLTALFSAYYKLTHKNIRFKNREEKTPVSFGFITGVSISRLKFKGDGDENLTETEFPSSTNIPVGIFLNFGLPRSLAKWSVANELLYTSYKTSKTYMENQYKTSYATLGYGYLKLDNMLRYSYYSGRLSLFLNAGFTNGLVVNETNYKKTIKSYSSGEENVTEGKVIDEIRHFEHGFLAGIGCNYIKIMAEIRYETSTGMSQYVDIKSPVNRIYLLAGYQF